MPIRIQSAEELEVCEEVGRGGFGVVYRGIVKATNTEVAIKQIDLENEQADLFEVNKEILIISECRLPQITEYLGCFVRNFKLWVIMEYVNGGSVFELLKPGPISEEATILIIVKEMLIALQYLHDQGKIHRDLKSQNVLLNTQGEVKLTDFGVSTQLSSNFSRRNTTVGTPYWMAPEVILNNKGGHSYKADLWSLGCCTYELFHGKPPLQDHYPPMKALRQISRCEKDDDFLNLIGLEELAISNQLKDFLAKCFIVDPKQRYSATKLLQHEFITKNATKANDFHLRKSLKQLITRKKLWDQDNHDLKKHRFYMPTEMVKNQQKWNDADQQDEVQPIQFDFSTINISSSTITPPPSSSISLSPVKSFRNSVSPAKSATKQDNYKNNLRQELNKVLNKVIERMDSKNNLTTEQYDRIVALNNNILDLMSFTLSNDSDHMKKILICQYFKYLLKELSKTTSTDGENVRTSLQKLIIPSNFQISDIGQPHHQPHHSATSSRLKVGLRSMTRFDEIENSLFESWMDKMTSHR